MPELFDMGVRAMRRDRAARTGVELFLYERAFADCLERIEMMDRQFDRALLIGCPDPSWPDRLRTFCANVDVREPGPLFAQRSNGTILTEDAWAPPAQAHDLVVAISTLDTVNDLPLALRLIAHGLQIDGLLIGAMAGGDTLPRLREAMRAADGAGGAAPHVHPRIEPSALAPLLAGAGYGNPVVDVDRVSLSYSSLQSLVRDLRSMGATNVLTSRSRFVGKAGYAAAAASYTHGSGSGRTIETVEILHFAGWRLAKPAAALTL